MKWSLLAMRLNRFKQRRQVTPYLWGWSVFTFAATVPTHTYGHMLATGLQFDPYRESIAQSQFSLTTPFWRRYINFSSFSPVTVSTSRVTVITSVATSSSFGVLSGPTITPTTISINSTKNRLRIDSALSYGHNGTIATNSLECAIGRL